jgi:hypothetical protein
VQIQALCATVKFAELKTGHDKIPAGQSTSSTGSRLALRRFCECGTAEAVRGPRYQRNKLPTSTRKLAAD